MTTDDKLSTDNDGSSSVTSEMSQPDGKPKYEVGYRRPPATHRFTKGKSGNPKGRAKAPIITDVRPIMDQVIAEQIRIGPSGRTVSRLEAALRAEAAQALKGNSKAIRRFFTRLAKAGLISKRQQKPFIEIVPAGAGTEDGALVDAYEAEKANREMSNANG